MHILVFFLNWWIFTAKFYQAFERNQHQFFPDYSTKCNRNINIPTSVMKLVLPWWQKIKDEIKRKEKENWKLWNKRWLGGQRTGCPSGGPLWFPASVCWLIGFCSSSLVGSMPSSGLLKHCTHVVCRHTRSQSSQTHAIKMEKGKEELQWNEVIQGWSDSETDTGTWHQPGPPTLSPEPNWWNEKTYSLVGLHPPHTTMVRACPQHTKPHFYKRSFNMIKLTSFQLWANVHKSVNVLYHQEKSHEHFNRCRESF